MKELLIVLVLVLIVFGTKKLRNMGGDLGKSVKDFKDAVNDGDNTESASLPDEKTSSAESSESVADKEKDSTSS